MRYMALAEALPIKQNRQDATSANGRPSHVSNEFGAPISITIGQARSAPTLRPNRMIDSGARVASTARQLRPIR